MNQFGAQKFSFKKPIMILMLFGIGIGSVSSDMKKILSVIYRIGRFEKWDLSVSANMKKSLSVVPCRIVTL